MRWSYSRALGKKWLQAENVTQGSASGVGVATITAQKPEHESELSQRLPELPPHHAHLRQLEVLRDCLLNFDSIVAEVQARWVDDLTI